MTEIKKALVLGSEGQIGKPLCEYLKSQNIEAIPFDIVLDDELHDLASLRPGASGALNSAMRDCDFVFFLAFDVGGSTYLKKYQKTFEFINNNSKLMSNTFEALRRNKKPFIFASSQMSNMLDSPYGAAKFLGENFTHSLDGLVVKFWNVYGPERDTEKFHVIPDLIMEARETGSVHIKTTGEECRQFLYAEDCCKCLLTLAQNYESLNKEKNYHITSFEWTSILDIANIIAKKMKKLVHEDCDFTVFPGAATDTVQNSIKNEPDPYIVKYWRPETSIEQGIEKMIHFYCFGEGKDIIK